MKTTPVNADTMAEIHAAAMAVPRPWTAAEFRGLLIVPNTIFLMNDDTIIVGRTMADEAELLTLAVRPEAQGRGLGRAAVRAYHARAAKKGATESVLEVAETNAAARALYAAEGYREAGRRAGYYEAPTGRIDALILRASLSPPRTSPPSGP